MSQSLSLLVLLLAAALEALGDAAVRKGIHATAWQRNLFFIAGALVLFLYGWTVNRPPWKFGEVLGLYVVFFFLLAQAISILLFNEYPPRAVWIGGAFIATGGAIIAVAR